MEHLTDNRESFTVTTTYLADKEYSVKFIRWLLKLICLWPHSTNISFAKKILYEFLIFIYYCLMFGIIVPYGLALFIEERGNTDILMFHFGPFTFWIMASLKYSCMLLHVNDIRSCVEYIEADWRTVAGKDREVMLKNAKIGSFVACSIIVFMYGAAFCYSVTNIIEQVLVENSSLRQLPYLFYSKIVDIHVSPTYEMVLIIQIISSIVTCSVTIALCAMTAIFVMHACGQLNLVRMRLDTIMDNCNDDVEILQQRLEFIVEHHLRVINFVSHIEEIIYLTCLVELSGCSFLLCLVGYCSIMDWNKKEKQNIPTYCVLSLSIILNIFILCYIGETLSEQYRRVGIATYMADWYRLPRKIALGLLLINLRSNSLNINLTAGKMMDLSLSTFGNVLKAAVTYMNMFRAMNS